jgi:hypothetical protein
MPATFPSHQGAVLPLKLWRPRWFDGVALAVGAASPDVAYIVDGSGLPVWPLSHQPLGLVLWCLPVTLALSWLFRSAAAVVAAHLPRAGRLELNDYGALRDVRPQWLVTVTSALIGAASHLLLDALDGQRPREWALHLIGAFITWRVAVHIGRYRLLRTWHGSPPAVARRPVLFWTVAVVVAAAGLALVPFLPAAFLAHTTGTRILAVAALALLAGAAAARTIRPAAA